MNPPAFTLKLLAALVAGSTLFTALPAHAGRDDDRRDHQWRESDRGQDRHPREWESLERVVIKDKVIVERPAMRESRYYQRDTPAYYDRSVPVYPPSRYPSAVVGVDVPPSTVPLR